LANEGITLFCTVCFQGDANFILKLYPIDGKKVTSKNFKFTAFFLELFYWFFYPLVQVIFQTGWEIHFLIKRDTILPLVP